MQEGENSKMLIFLDSETTGLETNDKVCSIAIVDAQSYVYELINEGKKIPALASSVNHITNEMIQDKPTFQTSKSFAYLQEHNKEENILVGHNIKFDLEKLASSGFIWQGKVIDTLRVTKHLIPECEFFSLQVLRYELQLYRLEEVELHKYGIKDALHAHHALLDAFVSKLLFEYLRDLADVETMQELTFKNVLLQKFSFGKYKGRYIEEICFNDASYLQWLLSTDVDEDLKYSINYYLGQI